MPTRAWTETGVYYHEPDRSVKGVNKNSPSCLEVYFLYKRRSLEKLKIYQSGKLGEIMIVNQKRPEVF